MYSITFYITARARQSTYTNNNNSIPLAEFVLDTEIVLEGPYVEQGQPGHGQKNYSSDQLDKAINFHVQLLCQTLLLINQLIQLQRMLFSVGEFTNSIDNAVSYLLQAFFLN